MEEILIDEAPDEAPDAVSRSKKRKDLGGEEKTSNVEHSTSNVEVWRRKKGKFETRLG